MFITQVSNFNILQPEMFPSANEPVLLIAQTSDYTQTKKPPQALSNLQNILLRTIYTRCSGQSGQ